MNRFFIIFVIALTLLFLYYDSQESGGLYNSIKFLIYALLVNILTAKLITNGKDKEMIRIIEERNLLQTLLLKKERISSQKLQRTIKKAERMKQTGRGKK